MSTSAPDPALTSGFSYKSLATPSSIRVLELLPNEKNETLVCRIHHEDLIDLQQVKYTAVSYQWGKSAPCRHIQMIDHDDHTIYTECLHETLWQLLNHLPRQEHRYYWTDRLCLNQLNKQEIEQQVPRMGNIYSAASDVLIWLGNEEQDEAAMKLIQDCPGQIDPMDNKIQEAVVRLLLLPYWSRIWIVQEIALAKKALVACGRYSVDLDCFHSKVRPFRDLRTEFDWQPTIWSFCQLRARTNRKMALWELVDDFQLSTSTKTINKIYGLLGLVEDAGSTTPSLDVNLAKEPFEVFWDTAFELRPPWDRYSSILRYLGNMLWEPRGGPSLHDDIRGMIDYAQNPRTSQEHARLTNLALSAIQAADALAKYTDFDFKDWNTAIETILKSATAAFPNYTKAQNALVVGLILAAMVSERNVIWETKNKRKHNPQEEANQSHPESAWQCASHRGQFLP